MSPVLTGAAGSARLSRFAAFMRYSARERMTIPARWSRGDLSLRTSAGLIAVLIAASAFLRGFSARGVRSPWIVPDELIYSSLARSFAATGSFAVRGVHTAAYSPVYPLVLSWAFAGRDPASAYAAAKWTNAVVMSLVAVPVFLLARRLLPNWLAVAGAALALLVPSMAYTDVLLTENAFYPVFLLAVLAIVRALERPTAGRQLVALAAIALAFLTRAQAIVFVPILLLAIALVAIGEPGRGRYRSALWRELRLFRPTWLTIALAALAILAEQAARGQSPSAFLGTYATTLHGYPLERIPRWLASQIVDLELYLGFLPLVPATIAACALVRRKSVDRGRRAIAAAAIAVVICMLLLVAAFSAGSGDQASSNASYPALPRQLHERYLFYVAPLYLVFFLYWLYRRRDFSNRLLTPLIAVAIVLPLSLPYAHLLTNAGFEALALIPWNNSLIAGRNVPFALAVTAAILLPLLFVRRGTIVLLQVGIVVGSLLIVGLAAGHNMQSASLQPPSSHTNDPSWIDRAVPAGQKVAVLWMREPGWSTGRVLRREHVLWRAEFFNASIERFFYVGTPMHYGLPEVRARLRGGRLVLPQRPAGSYSYVLAASPAAIGGRVVAQDRRAGLLLYRLAAPASG